MNLQIISTNQNNSNNTNTRSCSNTLARSLSHKSQQRIQQIEFWSAKTKKNCWRQSEQNCDKSCKNMSRNSKESKSKVEANIETQQSKHWKWQGQGFDPWSGQRQKTQDEQEQHQRQNNVVLHHSAPLRCLLVPSKHNNNSGWAKKWKSESSILLLCKLETV